MKDFIVSVIIVEEYMFDLRKSVILLTIIVTLLTLSIMSCKKTGSLLPNQKPVVEITSYEGKMIDDSYIDDPSIIDTLVGKNDLQRSLFQQKIFWSAYDVDGDVTGYAFRIKDKFNNPLQLAGHEAISEDGWVYHYKPGADQSFPLISADGVINHTVATIWTNELSATVNFLAANSDADSSNTPNIFELKCKDNRGLESDIERRAFLAYSEIPEVLVTTSKGNVQDRDTGTGLRFKFSINDEDPFIPATPYFFRYRIFKIDKDTEEPVDTSSADYKTWYTTQYYANINEVNISGIEEEDRPVLTSDFSDEAQTDQVSSTCIEVVAFDLAGIESESKKVSFRVHNNYTPETIMYDQSTRALGDYHYTMVEPENLVVPQTEGNDGTLYSMPLFRDRNNINSVIWSNNLKLYFSWGFRGEYEDNDPTKDKENKVVDASAADNSSSYYSEILYFDIRMETKDGEKLDMIPELRTNVISDTNGTQWIRIPKAHSSSQKFTLTNMQPDTEDDDSFNTLYVRAVDNQFKVDETPVEYRFKTIELLPYEDRNNVLLLSDKTQFTTVLPKDRFYERYSNLLSNYLGSDSLRFLDIEEYGSVPTAANPGILSPTDFANNKVLLITNESLTGSTLMDTEYEALRIFSIIGGNFIIVSGNGHAENYSKASLNFYPFYGNEFGMIPIVLGGRNAFAEHGGNYLASTMAYFEGATSVAGSPFNDIDLKLGETDGEYGYVVWNNISNHQQVLGGCGALNDSIYVYVEYPDSSNIHYLVGSLSTNVYGYEVMMKNNLVESPGYENSDHGLDRRYYKEMTNGASIARYKKAPTAVNPRVRTNYLICFPPTFMDQVQMKDAMEKIMDDILQY